MLGPTAHVDTFARDNLPPMADWPEFLALEGFAYPEYINAAVELTDRMVERGFGDYTALIGHVAGGAPTRSSPTGAIGSPTRWSRIMACAGQPGAGALGEQPCDDRDLARRHQGRLRRRQYDADAARCVANWRRSPTRRKCGRCALRHPHLGGTGRLRQGQQIPEVGGRFRRGTANHDVEPDRTALDKPVRFKAVETGRDDVALLGFTSGPRVPCKATMHFHRDPDHRRRLRQTDSERPAHRRLRRLLRSHSPSDSAGSRSSLRFGFAAALIENATPPNPTGIIETFKATICFTAPTAYRAMLAATDAAAKLSSLRLAVSAGVLPAAIGESWMAGTGSPARRHGPDRNAARLHR